VRLKLALPKGRLQRATSNFLRRAGLDFSDYEQGNRLYRLKSQVCPDLFAKVFHEKDIAVQVAIGNYDLGICGLDWVEELLVKYPSEAVIKLRGLGYGKRQLFVASSSFSNQQSLEDLNKRVGPVRLVSEYPNLAEAFSLRLRLANFRVFPVWGAAEAYPPEQAELALVSASSAEELLELNLVPLREILDGEAFLLANRESLEKKNLGSLLSALYRVALKSSPALLKKLLVARCNRPLGSASFNLTFAPKNALTRF